MKAVAQTRLTEVTGFVVVLQRAWHCQGSVGIETEGINFINCRGDCSGSIDHTFLIYVKGGEAEFQ